MILSDGEFSAYFNFIPYPGLDPMWVLPRETFLELDIIFKNRSSLWFMHNAKFDMAMLANEGATLRGRIHCTMQQERIVFNIARSLSLAETAKRYGLSKSTEVDEYFKAHQLKSYADVPFKLMQVYGENDAVITHKIGIAQIEKRCILDLGRNAGMPPLLQVYENEMALTRVGFELEQRGILIDREFCAVGLADAHRRLEKAKDDFLELIGQALTDSAKFLAPIFTRAGETVPKTDAGNDSLPDWALEKFTSPVAAIIREYRDANKRATTYFKGFLDHADKNDIVHASLWLSGPITGRMSCREPNLQNLTKESPEAPYNVRRAFIPRPGFCFVMLDYDQMEYRLMLNYAAAYGDMKLINLVLGGMDVHQATATVIQQMFGIPVPRDAAKAINFGLLYGQGVASLAAALGMTQAQAKDFKARYFEAIPGVSAFIYHVKRRAQTHRYVTNWFGRRCMLEGANTVYKMVNHLIQGGCADVVKLAMVQTSDALKSYQSKLILPIHDELLFEIHETELYLVRDLKKIMESVYPAKHLPLTCGIEHSWKSWADKVKGLPYAS